MPLWFVLSLLAGVFSTGFHATFRHSLSDHPDSSAFSWWFEFTRIIGFGILSIFFFSFDVSLRNILVLLALGGVEFFGIYSLVKMHTFAHLSISSIVSRLRVVWVPILSFLLIGEKLPMLGYLGIVIVFLGLVIVVSPHKLKLDKGVKYALLFSITSAVLGILMKEGASFASTPVVILVMSIPTTVLLPFVLKNSKERLVETWSKKPTHVILATLFNMITMGFMLAAFRVGPVGPATAVTSSMMILAVLVGIFFFGEKEDMWKKLIGSAVTIAGIILLKSV